MCALQLKAGEMPLCHRLKQFLVNYWINLRGHVDSTPTKKGSRRHAGRRTGHKNQVFDGQGIVWQETWDCMMKNFAQLWCGLSDLSGY